MPGSRTPTEPHQPVTAARERLLRMRDAPIEEWRALISEYLTHAYATGDIDELASTVQTMTYLLDAEGRFHEALGEVRHALRLAAEHTTARALLLVIEASVLSALGEHDEALATVERSEHALRELGAQAPLKCLVMNEAVRFQLLMQPSPRVETLLQTSLGPQTTGDHLFLLSWYVPWLAARGRSYDSVPIVRQLGTLAAHRNIVWREVDARVFEAWRALLSSNRDEPEGVRGPNVLAGWRMACLRLWSASARHNVLDVQDRTRALSLVRPRLGTADLGPPEVWDAWYSALVGGLPSVTWSPPRRISLANLPGALATAHAVAVAGSVADAHIWLRWVAQAGRLGIESSLEWPVGRRRLQALLNLRVGRLSEARKLFSDAAAWADHAGFAIEAAVARLQLGHLSATRAPSDPWRQTADAARSELVEMGVDPLPHVEAVNSCLLAGRRNPTKLLTPRELEVLRALARGLTYRAAAEELEIAGPTVQSFAHKIYEKLGVSGRHQALQRAQELGLL